MKKRANSEPAARTSTLRRGLLASGLWLGLGGPALARRYEGYDFPDKLQLGGASLQLNGVGKRAVAIIKGYLAALYLGKSASTPEQAYATPGPKRIQIYMLLDVGAEEFVKAVNKGVQRNCSEAEKAALSEAQPAFIAQLRAVNKVYKKDLIDMDYLPERGTLLSINGKPAGNAIPGPELYQALLKVFLGERPVDKRLKSGLLGGSPD
ncbi:hypothetical protein G8A07_14080 [Roseateles sp. DAIF2]|nr:hypothetical protein G8A07_14080 [Roseateles sp. DAIF2]